jgi:hypothetical protein
MSWENPKELDINVSSLEQMEGFDELHIADNEDIEGSSSRADFSILTNKGQQFPLIVDISI